MKLFFNCSLPRILAYWCAVGLAHACPCLCFLSIHSHRVEGAHHMAISMSSNDMMMDTQEFTLITKLIQRRTATNMMTTMKYYELLVSGF